MAFEIGHIPANKGKSSTVDPIQDPEAVKRIKQIVSDDVRLSALVQVSIQSALRAGDLTRLCWNDTMDDGTVITIVLLESKTGKRKVVPLPAVTSAALRKWRAVCDSSFIYASQRKDRPLTVAAWGRILKSLCEQAGVQGRHASHTARKTFCRISYTHHGTDILSLMQICNHSDPRITLRYMGCMDEAVAIALRKVI